ncbi:hypothetical protein B0H34DRAFT_677269 [Crassisporium funariophilum]|nr:hypothetical protein B0H34DRAFT_677269 [Crassisporium funariophilum]
MCLYKLKCRGKACQISKLPPELLALVFTSLIDQYDSRLNDEDMVERREQEADSLIWASRVTKHWRSVALSCFKSWGQVIDMGSSHLSVKELLERSRSAPLIIHSRTQTALDQDDPLLQVEWTTVLEQQHRFQVFHLTVDGFFNPSSLIQALQKPAPLLELFAFKVDTHCVVPSGFFSGLNLTSLEVDHLADHVALTVAEWLELLAGQQSLKSLRLWASVSDRVVNSLSPPLWEVELKNLEELCIQYCGTHSCAQLLGHLVLPLTCTIEINISACADTDHSGMHSALRKHLAVWKREIAETLASEEHWQLSHNTQDSSFEIVAFQEFGKFDGKRFGFSYYGCDKPSSQSLDALVLPILDILGELCPLDRAIMLELNLNLKDVRPDVLEHVLNFVFQFKEATRLCLKPYTVNTFLPRLIKTRGRESSNTTEPLGAQVEPYLPSLMVILLDKSSSFEAQPTRKAFIDYLRHRNMRRPCSVVLAKTADGEMIKDLDSYGFEHKFFEEEDVQIGVPK